jgi:serine/threonine-protein kinase HipA
VAEVAVFHEGEPVGTINRGPDGASFAYASDWLRSPRAFPISIQMPLAPGHMPPGTFERWAAGLLPEGAQRAQLARQLGLAPDDTLGILARTGRDTAGALSIGRPTTEDSGGLSPVGEEAALERLLEELPRRPLLAGQDGVSMALGGSRAKLPVVLDGALDANFDTTGRIAVPHGGAPSTHILKPGSQQLFGGVQNEALCLVLARRCGLHAPAVTTGKAGSRSYLLVQRYDRVAHDGGWRRLHQETFAQALGKSATALPTLGEVLTLTRQVMCAPDVLGLIDYLIFNVLVCNPAADACNFSLLLAEDGATLAPIHGVTCVAKWAGASPKLGRMIAGEHLDWPQWKAFAAECGLNATRLLARVEGLASAVLDQVHEAAAMVAAMPAGPHPLMPHLVEAIEARAQRHRSIAERYAVAARRESKAGADRRDPPPLLTVVSPGG